MVNILLIVVLHLFCILWSLSQLISWAPTTNYHIVKTKEVVGWLFQLQQTIFLCITCSPWHCVSYAGKSTYHFRGLVFFSFRITCNGWSLFAFCGIWRKFCLFFIPWWQNQTLISTSFFFLSLSFQCIQLGLSTLKSSKFLG